MKKKNQDKSQISLEEAVIDAYLHTQEGMDENTFCVLPTKKFDLPLPRIFSRGEKQDKSQVIAVIPGSHLSWMLSRKNGFSWARAYLEGLVEQLDEDARVQIWSLWEEWADDRLVKLEEITGIAVERFGPARRAEVIGKLKESLSAEMETHGNWLLESWRLFQFDVGTTLPPTQ